MAEDDSNPPVIPEPTALERISESALTGMVASGLAAFVGGPLAAMLPVLAQSLAVGRRKQRVEEALRALSEMLTENAAKVRELSDQQFRVVSEIIETTITTAQQEKLEYLQRAAQRVIAGAEIRPHEAEWIARVIRDVSADEVDFLLANLHFEQVAFANEASNIPNLRAVLDDEPVLAAASGLVGLGILIPGKNTISAIGAYRFNPLAQKLAALFRKELQD